MPLPVSTGMPDLQPASLPARLKADLERALDEALPAGTLGPPRLIEAMRYALLAPAKRVRGVLAGLAARQFGGDASRARPIAVAIELVHAASLVLDDMPSMDDAVMRRGRPTTHRVYGDDTAMLAAIGLMNHATLQLALAPAVDDRLRARLTLALAAAIGPDGLVGGQEQDLRQLSPETSAAAIEDIHRRKTGVLFSLATEAGARLGGASEASAAAMYGFGAALGLAFQTYDDVLDAQSTAVAAGKDVGKDLGKATLVATLGLSSAKARADQQVEVALSHLAAAGGDAAATRAFVAQLLDMLAGRSPRIFGG